MACRKQEKQRRCGIIDYGIILSRLWMLRWTMKGVGSLKSGACSDGSLRRRLNGRCKFARLQTPEGDNESRPRECLSPREERSPKVERSADSNKCCLLLVYQEYLYCYSVTDSGERIGRYVILTNFPALEAVWNLWADSKTHECDTMSDFFGSSCSQNWRLLGHFATNTRPMTTF